MPDVKWTSFVEVEPGRRCHVIASRLPLRSYARIPMFMRLTVAVRRQLAESAGLLGYSLRARLPSKTFLTLSAWTDQEALTAFARGLPHLDAMADLRPHIGPTKFVTWDADAGALPIAWDDAIARLDAP